MNSSVKPYSVIAQDNWTVDFLARVSNAERFGLKLTEVVEFNPHRTDPDLLNDDENYHYVEVSSVSADTGMIEETKLVAKSEIPSRAKLIGHTGDVLISTVRPERGLVAIIPKELDGCIVTNAFVVLSPIKISSEILYFTLRSPICRNELSSIARGSAVPTMTIKQLKDYTLPIHSVSTEFRNQAAELYRLLVQKSKENQSLSDIVEDVFKRTILAEDSAPGAESPKHGVIKYASLENRLDVSYYLLNERKVAKWHVPLERLSELILTTRAGLSVAPSEYVEDGIPYVRIQDLDNETINLGTSTTAKIAPKDYGRYELVVGDLLIARVGTVGKCNVVSESMAGAIASQHLLIIKTGDQVIADYLAIFMKTKWGRSQFDSLSVGVAQQFIQQSALDRIVVPIPDGDQQQAIVTMVQKELRQEDDTELKRKIETFYSALLSDS